MQDLAFRQLVERVKQSHPIEEVVQSRVPGLKRAGSLWKACCPFHDEKTPSFVVDPARGSWHCFGACSEGGDVIGFLQRFDGTSFWETLTELANRAGIELPERGRSADDVDRFRTLYDVLERAERLYAAKLRGPEGHRARAYLAGRGLEENTLEAFGVGFAPTGNALLEAARRAGQAEGPLLEAGLVRRGDDGSCYDFFRGRLMIPIRDERGRTVGFGGRLLPGADGPKYVNTSETPVFKKGRIVYGLDRARDAARRERHLCLVEGYTDVMSAHQAGVGHVAAVLGTATTPDHARLVRRTGARRVTLFFDGDDAGRKAVHKALGGLLSLDGVTIDVVALPEGSDPCDLFVSEGRPAFERLLAAARGWFEFLVEGLAELPTERTADLVAGVGELVESLACLPRPVERDALLARAASVLGLDVAALRDEARASVARHERARSAGRRLASDEVPGGRARPRGRSAAEGAVREEAPEAGGRVTEPPRAGGAGRRRRSEGNPRRRPAVNVKREVRAWRELVGAMLADNSLIAVFRPVLDQALPAPLADGGIADAHRDASQDDPVPHPCEDAGIARVLGVLLDRYDDAEDDELALDGPALARALTGESCATLPEILESEARRAESPRALAAEAVQALHEVARQRRLVEAKRFAVQETGVDTDPAAWSEDDEIRVLESFQIRATALAVLPPTAASGGATEGDLPAAAQEPPA